MRLHSNIITAMHVINALHRLQDDTPERRALIPRHVTFKVIRNAGSRARARAVEIQLTASERDNGRRYGNTGSYGATSQQNTGEAVYAATFDEWGWLLAELYSIDPDMIVGSATYPTYSDRDDFDRKTGLSYNPGELLTYLLNLHSDPYPYVSGAAGKTKKGYIVGRFGFGRIQQREGFMRPQWYAHKPRTVEQVREHARLVSTAAEVTA